MGKPQTGVSQEVVSVHQLSPVQLFSKIPQLAPTFRDSNRSRVRMVLDQLHNLQAQYKI